MRKNHPVRRVILTTVATTSGVVLLVTLKPDAAQAPDAAAPGIAQGKQATAGNHTATGDAVRTKYGDVRVRLTLTDGRITESEAVQAPEGGHNDDITKMSVPTLNKETVTAQTADIDTVSGATYTSDGYRRSLQSALDKAKKDGLLGRPTRTVDGKPVQTKYGPVQVRLTLTDGKITKSEAVQAPEGGHNDDITKMSVPTLNKETVTAQTADIDSVSGATYTSDGYTKSLQSALDRVDG
ncbi:hypothetical protein SRB5_43230 [Streptomyces sp. RB5]|uniref:FMN-binding domain-containing protein n=1 Tax=Streptomyces smaragdinus TaxID=2585196 RepID=A0A7K0CL68_9ACTN|nr:FMN-binding protein [Streptomyces smaragdinus]MQY14161.1 hypothetical protein [Streptomyces smaragdinus]